MSQVRTSLTDPLRIPEVALENSPGTLGITLCPGKCGDSRFGVAWQRDLTTDIRVIVEWGAKAVLTLVEEHEMRQLNVPDLGRQLVKQGIDWHHLPIVDEQPPASAFARRWPKAVAASLDLLEQGHKVLVHCRGGLGRAGTVAACLLIETGLDPSEAIRRVRAARPGAIETKDEERYVARFRRGGRLDGLVREGHRIPRARL